MVWMLIRFATIRRFKWISKHLLYGATRPFLHIILFIKDFLQHQICFNRKHLALLVTRLYCNSCRQQTQIQTSRHVYTVCSFIYVVYKSLTLCKVNRYTRTLNCHFLHGCQILCLPVWVFGTRTLSKRALLYTERTDHPIVSFKRSPLFSFHITKTRLYSFDPLKPHFLYSKTGVYRGIQYFSYVCYKT